MPTYQYRCRDCGTDLEVHQAFTDDPLTECRTCGGNLRKVFSAVGISFKGSGFYKNDSRGKTSSITPSEDSGTSKTDKSEKSEKSEKGSSDGAASSSDSSTKSSESSSTPSASPPSSTSTSTPASSPTTKSA